jgi:hypothetical protein
MNNSVTRENVVREGGFEPGAKVVGALAALPGTSASSLLAELDEPGEELDMVEEAAVNPWASTSPTGHVASAAATFAPSIGRLDEASFWLLAVAAALNVAPLPVRAVVPVAEQFATGKLGAPSSSRQATGTLLSLSLLRGRDQDTIELHGLVSAAVLRRVPDQPTFVRSCVDAVSMQLAELLGDVESIATHRANLRVAAFGEALALRSGSLDDGFHPGSMRAIDRFLHVERRYSEAAEIEAKAAAKLAVEEGEDSRPSLLAQADLAVSLAHSGRRAEALELLSELSSRFERQFGPDDMDTLTVQHNLASQLFSTDAAGSRELGLDVYRRRLRVLGPDHPHTLFSLHTLLAANVVPPAYDNDVAAYRDLIERRIRVLGEDHTTTLTSMSNFAQRLVKRGDAVAAAQLARRVVERRPALYGTDHSATSVARCTLLMALAALPDPPEAEIRSLIAQLEHVSDASDLRTIVQGLSTVGESLRRAGSIDLAVELLRLARRQSQAGLPRDDLVTLLVEHNLAAGAGSQCQIALR